MDPQSRLFRFVLLFFACFMTFGSYFCTDMTSVLQDEMQGTVNCTKVNHMVQPISNSSNVTCCNDCLYLTPDEFNLLYSVRAWTVATIIPFIGFFIDKVGNKVSAILMSTIIVIGNSLFALGSTEFIRYSEFMLPTLIIGRFLLGIGEASTRVVQDRITAFWFRDKELSMAFGITLTASRLGSVLNFLVSPNISHKYGLTWALTFGAMLCLISFFASVLVTMLDTYGLKRSGKYEEVKDGHKSIRCRDIGSFNAEFWLIIITIMFFYSGFIPLVNNGSKYIHDMYGIDERKAAYIMGAVFDVSIPLSPIIGYVVDRFGGRYVYLLIAGIATLPAYILLDFTLVHPLIITVYLGFCYVSAAVGMWPCMPLMIESKNMGLALGLTIATQGFGIGATNAIVGRILGDDNSITNEEAHRRWRLVLIPLCVNMLISSLTGSLAAALDWKRGKKLSKKSKVATVKTIEDTDSLPGGRRHSCDSFNIYSESEPLLGKDHSSVN